MSRVASDNDSLFQIPQRYRFSSKSQQYGKNTKRQHVVLDTTKVQIFKQITTTVYVRVPFSRLFQIPQRYRFSSKSQHNDIVTLQFMVVLDTTKVQIFKQITTLCKLAIQGVQLFQIPQRYRFSSKSQQYSCSSFYYSRCFRYHKGTDFQANHNDSSYATSVLTVVLDTTKVQIFKQITTQ